MAQDEKPNGGNDEFKKRYYQKAKLLTDAIPDGMDFNKFQEKLSTDESYRKGVHDELSVALENGLLKKLPTYDRVNELYGIQSQQATKTFPTPDQLAIPVNQGEPVPTTGGQPVPTGQPVQPVQPVQPIDMPVGTIGSPVPELTPTGLPVLNPVESQSQSQGGTGLSQGQYQITDTTQIPQGKPVQPDIPPIPQMADTSAQVTSTSGQPATAEVPKDLTEVPNIPEALNTKLGEAESGFISGIGSELKGLSEAGYAIDSKIVKALEGTALEGAYRKLPKAEDSWIYQAGQSLQDLDKDFIYKNPKYEGGLSGTIATGLGNVASIMATGGFTPAGAIMRGGEIAGAKAILANGVKQFFSRPTIAGALQTVGFETDNARALHRMANSMDKDEYVLERASSGENPKDAEKAWDKLRSVSEDEVASAIIPTALASGGTEAIPLERLFMRISKPAQSILLNTLKTGGVQAFEEGIQEVIQQSIVNAGVGQTYNEAHKLTSGLGESAEGGAGTGFVLGTALSALMGKRAHIKQRVQNGELTVKEGIEELHDVQNAETHLQDKLTWAENLVSTVTDENVKKSMSDPKAETFFETNDAHITNPIMGMPKEVEIVLDKIDGDILVSAEGLHSAYEWVNNSFKETANSNVLTEAEKGATLNILSKMMGDIDKSNESTREAETAHIENDLPVSNETSLPKGQNKGEKSIPPNVPLMKPISPIKQVIEIKNESNDKTDKTGVSGNERSGETVIEAKPDESASPQEVSGNRVVQNSPEENPVTTDELDNATKLANVKAMELGHELTPDEQEHAGALMLSEGVTSKEAVDHVVEMRDNAEHKAFVETPPPAEPAPTTSQTESKTTSQTEKQTTNPNFPTEITPENRKPFTEFEAMPEAVKPVLLKGTKKSNPDIYRAETEFTDLMDKAENQGLWNPETRTMSDGTNSINLPTDSDAKAWLSQGGIKVVEAQSKSATEGILSFIEATKKKAQSESKAIDKSINNPEADKSIDLQSGVTFDAIKKIARAPFKAMGWVDSKIAPYTKKFEDAVSKLVARGMSNSNKYLAESMNILQGFIPDIARTTSEQANSRESKGQINSAAHRAIDYYNNTLGIVNGDTESLRRVHQVLDPEVYEGEVSKGNIPRVEESDLSSQERALMQTLRQTLDFIHQWHYDNGFIKKETYDKFKGKYSPRFWHEMEMEANEETELLTAMKSMGKGLDRSYIKMRKEVDEVSQDIIEDPVYATSVRLAQTLRNGAVLDYAKQVSTTDAVSKTEKAGYTKLEGKKYGALNGKWVRRDVSEDFQGYYLETAIGDALYKFVRAYGDLSVRKVLVAKNTVMDPVTTLGNIGGNITFAWSAGIDPVTFISKYIPLIAKSGKKGHTELASHPDYEYLLNKGVIGKSIMSGELQTKVAPNAKPATGIIGKTKEAVNKALDKMANFYGSIDDAAKLAAYESLIEYGDTPEVAIQKISESFQGSGTVGRYYDIAAKTPIIGNAYVKFAPEAARIAKNGITRRPLTTAAMIATMYIVANLSSKMADEDEEVRKIREARPFIPKIPMPNFLESIGLKDVPLTLQTKIGEVNAARLFMPMYIYDTGDNGYMGSVAEVSKYLPLQGKLNREGNLEPMYSDPLLGPIINLARNKDFRDKPILDPSTNQFYEGKLVGDKFGKILNGTNYMLHSYVPYYNKVYALGTAIAGEKDYYGRNRGFGEAVLNNFIKVNKMDKPEVIELTKKAIEFKEKRLEALDKNISQESNKVKSDIDDIEKDKHYNPDQKERKIAYRIKLGEDNVAEYVNRQAKIMEELNKLSTNVSKLSGTTTTPKSPVRQQLPR